MDEEISVFLNSYSARVVKLSHKVRELILSATPGCTETLHTGWKVISYGHKKKFCAIAPHREWVNLQFHAGASLNDAASLLQGSGKSMRHVKVAKASDLSNDLSILVKQAAAQSK